MKGFRLERLRRVRAMQERVARAAWAEAEVAALEREDRAQREADRHLQAREHLIEGLTTGAVDPRSVLADDEAIERLEAGALAARDRARQARDIAEQAREPWRERRVEAEALNRLRERWNRSAREAERTTEQRELDERASARHTARTEERSKTK